MVTTAALGPKQEAVVRQVRDDMRTFARRFVQATLTSSRTLQMPGMVIGECPSESRQLPVGFQSKEPRHRGMAPAFHVARHLAGSCPARSQ
jgi:hypothetical protein